MTTNRITRWIPIVFWVAVLAACGGGGSDEAPPAAIARVEIRESGLILTASGASRALTAVAYDAEDRPVEAPISWSSTTPGSIAIDAGGIVTAKVANGAGQIVAQSGGVRSAPLLVAVTQLPAGMLMLTDAQIVGDPVASDPDAAPSLDNTYVAVLTGVDAPVPGQLVVNTESKFVVGEVVSVSSSGGTHTVTLRLAPVRTLFPRLSIDETIDLSAVPRELNPDLLAYYEVRRDGDTYTLVPKPGTLRASGERRHALAASGTRALPPFTECDTTWAGEDGSLPISIALPPAVSITVGRPSLDLIYTEASGLERFTVRAAPALSFDGRVEVTAAFELRLECKMEIFTFRVGTGPLMALIAGLVPVGVGFEVGGNVTVATMGLGSKANAAWNVHVGLECPGGGDCALDYGGERTAFAVEPVVDLPSLGDLRVEPDFEVFAWMDAEVGNPFLRAIRFEALKLRAGGKIAASFAPKIAQITDTDYQSDYKASLEFKAGLGVDVGTVARLLGLGSLTGLEWKESIELAHSPTATAAADRATFHAGDTVRFSVDLDPASLEFLPGVNNVSRVLLVHRDGLDATVVASVDGVPHQTSYTLPYTATRFGSSNEFSAFVVTGLLPAELFALELATPRSLRISADLPGQIFEEGAAFTVTVETSDGGPYQPAPDLLVSLAPSCGSVTPASGRSDATGRFASGLFVAGCGESVAVVVEVRAGEGTPLLAQTTLDAVVGGFEFGDDIWLDTQAKIAAFNASGITRVVGDLRIELSDDEEDGWAGETALAATLPAVVAVGGDLSVSGPLTALSMSALTAVGGHLYVDEITTPVTASFGALRQVGGTLFVDGNTALGSVNFAQLQALDGLSVTRNPGVTSVNFPQLEIVGNNGLFVTDNSRLTSASFPRLASVLQARGGIFITDNDSITSLTIGPALIAAIGGGLFITDNAVLSSLANVSCDIVSPGGVWVTDNPAMPDSEAERLVECIRD